MNFKLQNYLRKIILFFLVLSPVVSFADEFDDGPEPPPAPIGDSIYLWMAVGLFFVLISFYLRDKKQKNENILTPKNK